MNEMHVDAMMDERRNLRYHSSGNYSSSHVYNESSYTITTSVTIRVTPKEDHFVSWGILWGFFVLGSVVAFYQVIREQRIMANRRVQSDDGEQVNTDGESVSTADITRSMVSFFFSVHSKDRRQSPIWSHLISSVRDVSVSKIVVVGHGCSRDFDSGSNLVLADLVPVCGRYIAGDDFCFCLDFAGDFLCTIGWHCHRNWDQHVAWNRDFSNCKMAFVMIFFIFITCVLMFFT
jgi:hypothetical protein